MSFQFKPAVRENVKLLLGIAGGTGSGKTLSALRVARGLAGPKGKIAVIDTEAGRAKHYVGVTPPGGAAVEFDHGDLSAPFTPARYTEAVVAADSSGYDVIVVDSATHEHAGDGGLLDMHDAELQRMAGDDWKRRETCKMAAWVAPKGEHRRFVSKLLQVRAHLILCFRAEEKIEMVKRDGKMVIQPKQSLVGLDGWIPVCEKNLPYEATASFLVLASNPGVPLPIKLQEQHKPFFPLDRPLTEEPGRLLAGWAAGSGKAEPPPDPEASTCAARKLWSGPITRFAEGQARGTKYWTFYGLGEGRAFNTTDEALMERCRQFVDTGVIVDVEWEPTAKGGKILLSMSEQGAP